MNWLGRLGLSRSPARVAPVGFGHTACLAAIHESAFARPWGAEDFEAFLIDPAVRLDGLFFGRDPDPSGFVLSRRVLDEAEILSVALHRTKRGRGHSRILMTHHLQALGYAGIRTVHLEVEEGNDPALALYGRLGFEPCGNRPGYYARPDGSRASAISMTLALSPSGRQPAS